MGPLHLNYCSFLLIFFFIPGARESLSLVVNPQKILSGPMESSKPMVTQMVYIQTDEYQGVTKYTD